MRCWPCLPRARRLFRQGVWRHLPRPPAFAGPRATRRSAIWDCGFPLDAPQTQYASSSFAMPIRPVFGTVVFNVHERVDMPLLGEMRAGSPVF